MDRVIPSPTHQCPDEEYREADRRYTRGYDVYYFELIGPTTYAIGLQCMFCKEIRLIEVPR